MSTNKATLRNLPGFRTIGKIGLMLMLVLLQFQSNAQAKKAPRSNEHSAIEKLIFTYQDALNASDANRVLALYTKDGVLMANAAPTAEGAEAVKGTYQYVFDNFTYTLQFAVLEVEVQGNVAFARSTSKGSFVIKASGQTVADENRELFVFEKENGQWKIARYMYNKTK
jgi:uncharacterized protein (TIGR02246 family)